jgi:hypothetical protein
LYLDSDSIPTRDPEYMFSAPNYKRLGIFATPDYWKTSANNPIWAIMGVKCRNEWEMETGQMFIDKKLHLDVFLLIQYMLERHEWVSGVLSAMLGFESCPLRYIISSVGWGVEENVIGKRALSPRLSEAPTARHTLLVGG